MPLVKETNYICVEGWMRSQLGLKGNELLIYAIIYGFSQAESQVYSGTAGYLAEWTGQSRRNVMRELASLTEKGLLIKGEKVINGVKFAEYRCADVTPWGMTNCHGGYDKMSHNKIINNIQEEKESNNINVITKEKVTEEPKKKGFVKPTLEEVQAYIKEQRFIVNAETFIDYYESNGWKVGKNPMKDWKAAVRTWEQKEKEKRNRYGNQSNSKPYVREEQAFGVNTGEGEELPF